MNSQLFDDWFKSWVKKNSEQDAEFIAPNPTAEEAFAGGYAAALRQSGGGVTVQEHARQARILYEQLSRTEHTVNRERFEKIVADHIQRALDEQANAPQAGAVVDDEHRATLDKYESDLDKLHKALGQSNLEVPGGFVEHVCAHLRHVRREVLRLADLHVITIGRAGEILALTVRQAREEMRKYQEEQATALAALKGSGQE